MAPDLDRDSASPARSNGRCRRTSERPRVPASDNFSIQLRAAGPGSEAPRCRCSTYFTYQRRSASFSRPGDVQHSTGCLSHGGSAVTVPPGLSEGGGLDILHARATVRPRGGDDGSESKENSSRNVPRPPRPSPDTVQARRNHAERRDPGHDPFAFGEPGAARAAHGASSPRRSGRIVAWRGIFELARSCSTSATSVVRFCTAIGSLAGTRSCGSR